MQRLFAYLLMLLLLISCQEADTRTGNTYKISKLTSIVVVSAGDMFSPFDKLNIPTFFNIGNLNYNANSSLPTIMLGTKKAKGQRVHVQALAMFSFEKDSLPIHFIVSYQDDFSDKALNYETFMVQNSEITKSIEAWFKSQCALGRCRKFKWSGEYKSYTQFTNKDIKN